MTPETPLRQLVDERGIHQNWIAKQLHVHPSLVSRWVNGKRRIPPRYLPKLSKLLGVPPQAIQRTERENH